MTEDQKKELLKLLRQVKNLAESQAFTINSVVSMVEKIETETSFKKLENV